MRKTFVYRLYPTKTQSRGMSVMLESHRRLYNDMLDERSLAFDACGMSITYKQQSARFKVLRSLNKWYANLNFSSAQATMRRLDKAYTNFFRRVSLGVKPGYPRFKGQGQFSSVEFPKHGDGCRLNENTKRLRIQHVGQIKVKLHRPTEGAIKTVSFKLEAGKWYAVVSCDLGAAPPCRKGESVGIDVGLSYFLTTSTGEKVDNPRHHKASLAKLRRLQRSVSRKASKRSKRRRKAIRRLQVQYAKVRNRRKDFHHKTARMLVDRYAFIAAEKLNIQGMLRNRRLARSIADAGWYSFLQILGSKAESAGSQVALVDPKYTSQDCSECGDRVRKPLSVRVHRCSCGCVLDRDHNAALNIAARAEPSSGKSGVT